MTSSTSNASQSGGGWHSLAPYIVPPVAASVAIVPAFYDMIAKSFIQQGLPAPSLTRMTVLQGLKGGVKTAPSVGVMVGAQMFMQLKTEEALKEQFPHLFAEDSNQAKASLTLASSVIVGGLSSPFVAVYNGKTMTPPWGVWKSLSKFSLKQAGAITLQETGFVAGIAAAGLVAAPMKRLLGDNKPVEYTAAAVSAALGSLFGHAGNTALTRWQNGLAVESVRQLSLGALRKARGNAVFGIVYKLVKEELNSTVENKK